jgi:hypothetical protein
MIIGEAARNWRYGFAIIILSILTISSADGFDTGGVNSPQRKQIASENTFVGCGQCKPYEYVAMLAPDTPDSQSQVHACASKFASDARNLADIGSCIRSIDGEREHTERTRKRFLKWEQRKFENDVCHEVKGWANCAQQLILAICDHDKLTGMRK